MNLNKYIVLLLIKNLNEGDGASLAAIDHNFFRISAKANIEDLKISNVELHSTIEDLVKDGSVFKNDRSNYTINESGEAFLTKNSNLKKIIKQGMS